MISIIVPFYNSEKYIARTLLSIQKQSYFNFEVLMIDDGSTDSSSQICIQFANIDHRFKYFYKNNSGVAEARNFGLNNILGEYITFVDSDDTIQPTFLEVLYEGLTLHNADISVCNIKVITKGNENFDFGLVVHQDKLITDLGFCLKQDLLGSSTLWNKLYKKKVFENIKFPARMVFEDNYVFHEIFGNEKFKVFLSHQFLYNYVLTEESITRVPFYMERYHDHVKGLIRRQMFFKLKNWKAIEKQTIDLILKYMIVRFLKYDEVRRDNITRSYLLKNLCKSEIFYKTKILVFLKMLFLRR